MQCECRCLWKPEEGIGFHGAEVPGNCELPGIGAGNPLLKQYVLLTMAVSADHLSVFFYSHSEMNFIHENHKHYTQLNVYMARKAMLSSSPFSLTTRKV